jgi:diguanylate cyclase (GGDEF)-like protein/PAS domain S-box-containing protein
MPQISELPDIEDTFRTVFDVAGTAMVIIDNDMTIRLANREMELLSGYSRSEIEGKMKAGEFIHPNDLERMISYHRQRRIKGESPPNQYFFTMIDRFGKERDIFLNIRLVPGTTSSVASLTDLGRARELENKLRESEENFRSALKELLASKYLFQEVIDCLPDPVFAIDIQGKVIAWNSAIESLTGVQAKDILGKADFEYAVPFYGKQRPMTIDFLLHPELEAPENYLKLRREGDAIFSEAFSPLLNNGKGAHLWCAASIIRDREGQALGALKTIKDFTAHKEMMAQLQYLGMHDILTGLYNRMYFEEEIARLDNNERHTPVTIIICDVDALKLVNDTMGHHKGDLLLKASAEVIRAPFRSSDVVARIGGDEFALLLPKTGRAAAEEACRRIGEAVKSYNECSPPVPLSLSVGFACGFPPLRDVFLQADHNLNRDKLLRSAGAKSHFIATLKAMLAERDYITEGHAERLEKMALLMADAMDIPKTEKADLLLLAKFHDLGKVGVSDTILFKPDKLTTAEMEEMKRHAEIGYRIAKTSPNLEHIAELILHHHEWWNGEGYPLALKGEQIPLCCRILAVIDAYDAMTHDRPYRKAFTCTQAVDEIRRGAGKQFDPYLVHVFIGVVLRNHPFDCIG